MLKSIWGKSFLIFILLSTIFVPIIIFFVNNSKEIHTFEQPWIKDPNLDNNYDLVELPLEIPSDILEEIIIKNYYTHTTTLFLNYYISLDSFVEYKVWNRVGTVNKEEEPNQWFFIGNKKSGTNFIEIENLRPSATYDFKIRINNKDNPNTLKKIQFETSNFINNTLPNKPQPTQLNYSISNEGYNSDACGDLYIYIVNFTLKKGLNDNFVYVKRTPPSFNNNGDPKNVLDWEKKYISNNIEVGEEYSFKYVGDWGQCRVIGDPLEQNIFIHYALNNPYSNGIWNENNTIYTIKVNKKDAP